MEKTVTYTKRVGLYKHYDPSGGVSQEVKTEDGKYSYYRFAPPMWYVLGFLWWKTYNCICGKGFKSAEAAELHYRKAYEEEKYLADNPIKS